MTRIMTMAAGVFSLALGAGCTEKRDLTLSYQRTGGLIGTRDEIRIQDGKITAGGRLLGEHRGSLTDEQRDELTQLLDGWERLESPAPVHRGADHFTHSVSHQGRTLTWTDQSRNVPPQLRTLVRRLEAIVRALEPGTSRRTESTRR